MRCEGMTQKGTQCKRSAIGSEEFCARHLKVNASKTKTNTNFGKMLIVSLTEIIKSIVKSEINNLSIHTRE